MKKNTSPQPAQGYTQPTKGHLLHLAFSSIVVGLWVSLILSFFVAWDWWQLISNGTPLPQYSGFYKFVPAAQILLVISAGFVSGNLYFGVKRKLRQPAEY